MCGTLCAICAKMRRLILDPQERGELLAVGAYYKLASRAVDFFDVPAA